ncbi:hypothetical protein OXIME_000752 [Oxyplasma meridianum]|uniref:Uncharacterized protein n=1 Tax=Oxyplasma meridianum TaxID=3073602 RepID=A0AAX4NFH0_9ARCH
MPLQRRMLTLNPSIQSLRAVIIRFEFENFKKTESTIDRFVDF